MKRNLIIISMSVLFVLTLSCKKDDDKAFLLLSAVGTGELLKNMPQGVPEADQVAADSSSLGGNGTLVTITGTSAAPQDYSDSNNSNQNDSGDSSDDNQNTSGASADDNQNASGASADDNQNASGDSENDENKSPVRHGKDVCSLEGTWYKDANTVFTYEGKKPAGFCFSKVKPGTYDVVLKVKHWVSSDNKGSKTIPSGYNEYEILISSGNQDAILMMPVNSKHWVSDSIRLQISDSNPEIKVSLQNPFCDSENCVNLQILSVHLKKSQGSAIAASIKEISQKHYPIILAIFVLALLVIVSLNLKNTRLKRN